MTANGDRTPRSIPVLDIDPDYNKHDGRDMRVHCFRCGRKITGTPLHSIRVDYDSMMLNAWCPSARYDTYYPIGSECVEHVPVEYRMLGSNVPTPALDHGDA